MGYYSRVRNMKRAAIEVVTRFGGEMPTRYEALLTLPGVGAYTAGAVASIAGGEAVPAVDGNVLRVWMRQTNDASDIALPAVREKVRAAVAEMLPRDAPGTFNAAMMELGACVCVPNGVPDCARCPVSATCRALLAGTQQVLPVKSPKRARRVEEKTVFALRVNGRYAVCRRPEAGLLAGLYQLPDAPGTLGDDEAVRLLDAWGARASGALAFYARKHVFTHVEWHMRVCCAEVTMDALPKGWRLLDESLALPTAYRVCLPEGESFPGI